MTVTNLNAIDSDTITRESVRREVHEAIDRLLDCEAEALEAQRDFSAHHAADAHVRAVGARIQLVEWIEAYADAAIAADTSAKRTPWSLSELTQTPALLAARDHR